MTQFRPGSVWTEREIGDWEACVATSYAMGLLYGGVTMPAPYTQAERERLEVRADEPQDLGATDLKAAALYGARLRGPSVTSSEAAFLARPGLGFCLTGVGSPVGAQAGTFTHEVFGICVNATTIRVYDPLLSAGAAPQDRTVAHMAAWMNGIAGHQVREVRQGEFGGSDPMIEALNGYPDGTVLRFQHGQKYQFFSFEGPGGSRTSWAWTAPATGNLDVPCEALVDLSGDGPAYFLPGIYTAPSGQHANAYSPVGYPTTLVLPAAPTGGATPDQVKAAVKVAKHEAAEDVAAQAGIPLVTAFVKEKYP